MIKVAQVIKLRNGQQVLSQFHKLLITVPISMSLPEWFNYQTILWVHHKISSEIVKHDSI